MSTEMAGKSLVGELFRFRGDARTAFLAFLSAIGDAIQGKVMRERLVNSEWSYLKLVPSNSYSFAPTDKRLAPDFTNTRFLLRLLPAGVSALHGDLPARLMVLGPHADNVNWLLDAGKVLGETVPPRVAVDQLVRDMVAPTSGGTNEPAGRQYLLTRIWAAVEGDSSALRSMSLYGDDLMESKLFLHLLSGVNKIVINANRAHLQDTDGKEVLSISSVGRVFLQSFTGADQLRSIDALLSYLDAKYIDWRIG